MHDAYCLKCVAEHPDAAVSWWMMASYAYYMLDTTIINDTTFDQLCAMIETRWDEIDHQHKKLIKRDCIKSGYYIGQYPLMVIGATEKFLKDMDL